MHTVLAARHNRILHNREDIRHKEDRKDNKAFPNHLPNRWRRHPRPLNIRTGYRNPFSTT